MMMVLSRKAWAKTVHENATDANLWPKPGLYNTTKDSRNERLPLV